MNSKQGASELSKYAYTIDKVGNRKTATETVNGQGRAISYSYDDLYRLTDEAISDVTNGDRTSKYTYDNVGNRLVKTVNGVSTTYVYDANDRLLNEKVNGAIVSEYTYDNNGSTKTKTENGVTTTYTWNDEKRLVSATVGNGETVEYSYNDQGIRVSSKQAGVETRYLLDEGITANVWEEYSANGTVQASYVYGNDLISQTRGSATSFYLVDGLGSTRLLTDSQGQVLNSYGYEAFGQTVSQTGTTSNQYQYAGEQLDAAIGDYYLRQRFYDTSSGRFGRMDDYEGNHTTPLSLNKYTYAHNNPIRYVDPSGRSAALAGETGAVFSILNILQTIFYTYQVSTLLLGDIASPMPKIIWKGSISIDTLDSGAQDIKPFSGNPFQDIVKFEPEFFTATATATSNTGKTWTHNIWALGFGLQISLKNPENKVIKDALDFEVVSDQLL